MTDPDAWQKGRHAGHDVVVVEVLVRREGSGQVLSAHRLQDKEDQEVVMTWPSYGLEQVAHGLLVEAVRREASLDVTLQASADPGLATRWATATPDEQEEMASRLAATLVTLMQQTIGRLAASAAREALFQLRPL